MSPERAVSLLARMRNAIHEVEEVAEEVTEEVIDAAAAAEETDDSLEGAKAAATPFELLKQAIADLLEQDDETVLQAASTVCVAAFGVSLDDALAKVIEEAEIDTKPSRGGHPAYVINDEDLFVKVIARYITFDKRTKKWVDTRTTQAA